MGTFKTSVLFSTLVLSSLGSNLYAAEAVYTCNGITRHGKGSALYDNHSSATLPGKGGKDVDTFRAKEGAKAATQDAVFTLSDGSVFQLFKYPKAHPLGDHLVAAIRHPGKKQAMFQVLPFGIPHFTINYNYQDTDVAGAPPGGDVMEHHVYCALNTWDRDAHRGDAKLDPPDQGRFRCEFDGGTEDENYTKFTSAFKHPLLVDWFAKDPKPGRLTWSDGKDMLAVLKSRLGAEYRTQIVDFTQGGQIYANYPDYLVDLSTGKPNGQRLQTVYIRLMTKMYDFEEAGRKRITSVFQCDRLKDGADPLKNDAMPETEEEFRNSDFFASK